MKKNNSGSKEFTFDDSVSYKYRRCFSITATLGDRDNSCLVDHEETFNTKGTTEGVSGCNRTKYFSDFSFNVTVIRTSG